MINGLIDEGSFFEIKQRFAKEIVTGFARLDGAAIGIIANNSKYLGGVFQRQRRQGGEVISICDALAYRCCSGRRPWVHDRLEG